MVDFFLQIITPTEKFYDGRIEWVEYNTTDGYVGVLPGHIPTVQIVAPGELVIHLDDDETKKAYIVSGYSRIMPDLVTILAQEIKWVDGESKDEEEAPEKIAKMESENSDFYRLSVELRKTLGQLSK